MGLWDSLWVATGLILIMEGVLPALSPVAFRETMLKITQMSDQALRHIGMVSMLAGAVVLYWIS